MSASPGTLHLVATPIGNLADLSPRATDVLRGAALVCCEDTRHSGLLLHRLGIEARLAVCNEHTEATRASEVIEVLRAGRDVALITDAGTPGISDPGQRMVRAVIDADLPVSAVPGPAALIVALVVSGLDSTRFVFDGFLPRSGAERAERLRELSTQRRTVVLYEAPHRLARTVDDLAAACGAQRAVVLARELTKRFEEVWRGTLDEARAKLADETPRGEYVIVLDGAAPPAPADDAVILAALRTKLRAGSSSSSAVGEVVRELALPKRRVYELALSLRGEP